MTENHGSEIGRGRIEVQFIQVVQDIEMEALDLDDLGLGEDNGPCIAVDVAAHGTHRGNTPQRLDHVGGTDITGVQNEVGALQGIERLRSDQAVSVGDYADPLQGDVPSLRQGQSPQPANWAASGTAAANLKHTEATLSYHAAHRLWMKPAVMGTSPKSISEDPCSLKNSQRVLTQFFTGHDSTAHLRNLRMRLPKCVFSPAGLPRHRNKTVTRIQSGSRMTAL